MKQLPALVSRMLSPLLADTTTVKPKTPIATAKPIQREQYIPNKETIQPSMYSIHEPKRIQRLRKLAFEGALGFATIEGQKINGAFAKDMLKAYDKGNDRFKIGFTTLPMSRVILTVDSLKDEGRI